MSTPKPLISIENTQARARLLALAFAALLAPILYALLRGTEGLLHPGGPDPASILFVGPSAYFRRCAIVATLTPGLVAAGLFLPERTVLAALPVLLIAAPIALLLPVIVLP